MKIRPLFEKYQRYLLAFSNTWYGRGYLGLSKMGKVNNRYPIVKVAPDGIHFYLGKQNGKHICKAVFFSKSQYLKKFRLALEGLELTSSLVSKIHAPDMVIPHFAGLTHVNWLPLVMRAEDTFNPDAHAETTSVDGYVERGFSVTGGNEAWATLRTSAGSGATDNGATGYMIYFRDGNAGDKFQALSRGIFLFDTSSLGNLSTILSSILSLYGDSQLDETSNTPGINIYSSSPNSNTTLVAADYLYTDFGTTAFCDTTIAYAAWNIAGYNAFTLNSNGNTAISKTSITKFATRIPTFDVTGTVPSDAGWEDVSHLSGVFADNGSNEPKLVVTYTPPPGAAILRNFI